MNSRVFSPVRKRRRGASSENTVAGGSRNATKIGLPLSSVDVCLFGARWKPVAGVARSPVCRWDVRTSYTTTVACVRACVRTSWRGREGEEPCRRRWNEGETRNSRRFECRYNVRRELSINLNAAASPSSAALGRRSYPWMDGWMDGWKTGFLVTRAKSIVGSRSESTGLCVSSARWSSREIVVFVESAALTWLIAVGLEFPRCSPTVELVLEKGFGVFGNVLDSWVAGMRLVQVPRTDSHERVLMWLD